MNTTTKERPIIFSGPMVRAILTGKKRQTRRLSGLKAINERPDDFEYQGFDRGEWHFYDCRENKLVTIKCPYGQPGDALWVKSTHWMRPDKGCAVRCADLMGWLKDDPPEHEGRPFTQEYLDRHEWQKKPSIHMPRWASRLRLPLKSVRVERVQDINECDIVAEGIPFQIDRYVSYEELLDDFRNLWDSINGKTYPWASNPWVWVLAFEVQA